MRTLTGRTAVVTGAASDLGAALAATFLDEGMRVVLTDLDGSSLVSRAGRLRSHGAEVMAVPTDLADPVAALADPDEIASRVVQAVRSGRFYLLTHPGHVSAVRVRTDTIARSEPLG